MHILFVDESGTPPKPDAKHQGYFVVGGIIIPETSWHRMRDALLGMKVRRGIRGEFKWRYFAPGNDDARNPMRGMAPEERNSIREEIYRLICAERAVRTLACVAQTSTCYGIKSINTQEDLYQSTYKPVTERFQYHLQDLGKITGRKEYGIVVGDHRGQGDDKRLRGHHQKLLHASGEFISSYKNLIEGLFLEPSHLSIGIQLADMVAGAVWRCFERGDDKYYQMINPSLRKSPQGDPAGYGIVKMPTSGWK